MNKATAAWLAMIFLLSAGASIPLRKLYAGQNEAQRKIGTCEIFLSDKTYEEIKTIGKKRPGWINPAEVFSLRGSSFTIDLDREEFSVDATDITTFRPSVQSIHFHKRIHMLISLHNWSTVELHETEYENGSSAEYITIYGLKGKPGQETYQTIQSRQKIADI